MDLVVLESPYAGDVEKNKGYARRCLVHSLAQGEAPIAGHMLYTQVLDDLTPSDRSAGIFAHIAWIRRADKVVVYEDRGISGGMKTAIHHAMRVGIPVEYRKID